MKLSLDCVIQTNTSTTATTKKSRTTRRTEVTVYSNSLVLKWKWYISTSKIKKVHIKTTNEFKSTVCYLFCSDTKPNEKRICFRIQIFKEQVICSSRAVVATFIIVILLFIGVGISVGVVFATIKSDKSSSSDSNSQNFGITF